MKINFPYREQACIKNADVVSRKHIVYHESLPCTIEIHLLSWNCILQIKKHVVSRKCSLYHGSTSGGTKFILQHAGYISYHKGASFIMKVHLVPWKDQLYDTSTSCIVKVLKCILEHGDTSCITNVHLVSWRRFSFYEGASCTTQVHLLSWKYMLYHARGSCITKVHLVPWKHRTHHGSTYFCMNADQSHDCKNDSSVNARYSI